MVSDSDARRACNLPLNPAGYLWAVGRNHARRERTPRPVFPERPAERLPWIEPGLPGALAQLSEGERVAVMLIHGLEWTYGEVAGLLGVSKSTVQTQAERAWTVPVGRPPPLALIPQPD